MKVLQTLQTFHLQGIVEEKTLEGHSNYVDFLVKINESTIASASWDQSIKIWDIITGDCLKTFEENSDEITYKVKIKLVKINGNTMASASYATINIWDIITGNGLKTLEGHLRSVFCLIKINGNTIASGSYDTTIKLWNLFDKE